MAPKPVEIKGTKEGLIIKLEPDIESEKQEELLLNTLEEKLNNAQDFFRGAKVNIISSASSPLLVEKAKLLCQKYGLKVNYNEKENIDEVKLAEEGEMAQVFWGDIRSGQKIESKNNIILLGNIHPGGEITAKGDIFVWGSIWGSAFAGADGDTTRTITAFYFKPLNLTIAGINLKNKVSIPEITSPSTFTPFLAYIQKGRINFKPYTG